MTKQSIFRNNDHVDCFAQLAMTPRLRWGHSDCHCEELATKQSPIVN